MSATAVSVGQPSPAHHVQPTDDGGVVSIPGSVRLDVVQALPRRRPPVLTESELHVAAELLEELGAVYAGEKLGRLANAVAAKIAHGLDLHPDLSGA